MNGQRPCLTLNTEFSTRLYLISAVSPSGTLRYQVRDKPFDRAAITPFLPLLLAEENRKFLLIWDNASIHDCAVVHAFLAEHNQARRLHLVKQPRYSPQLNADEQVWAQVKGHGLKNWWCQTLAQWKDKVVQELEKLKQMPTLIQQFFRHPDLGFC